MVSYIIRRILHSLIVVIVVTIVIFLALRLLPGDPLYTLISRSESSEFSQEQLDLIRHEVGLDRPLIIQYFTWVGGVFQGDLGTSIMNHTSVSDEIVRRLPISAYLGILALILGIIIGVPLGIISAVRRGTWIDTIVTTLANIGVCVPIFWLGIMLVFIFALRMKLLPVMGFTPPFENFGLSLKQIIMPVACLAIGPVAGNARQTRSIMLEVLRQDYIRTAWSKGLRERTIILRHALKNGFIPLLTFMGLWVSVIAGGSVLIEQVFNIPGMGRLAVDSLFKLDYPYVQGVVLVIAIIIVVTNLIIDISYGWFDPRIRFR
jgi:peptide/nickel transport system permease protein